jgi:hypothetical protein
LRDATSIEDGLIIGFLPQDVARNIEFTFSDPSDHDMNLGEDMLPDNGSAHGCSPASHCVGPDGRDLLDPELGASPSNCGWWFNVNFNAILVEDVGAEAESPPAQ